MREMSRRLLSYTRQRHLMKETSLSLTLQGYHPIQPTRAQERNPLIHVKILQRRKCDFFWHPLTL